MFEFLFLKTTPPHSLSFPSCKTWVFPYTHANHSFLAGTVVVKVVAIFDVSGREALGLPETLVPVLGSELTDRVSSLPVKGFTPCTYHPPPPISPCICFILLAQRKELG